LWEQAGRFAQSSYDSRLSQAERCGLIANGAYALVRLGRVETAATQVSTFDRDCSDVPGAAPFRSTIAELRPQTSLPRIPRTGLDFSAIDEFWRVADLLQRDQDPTTEQWRALLTTVGYRLSLRMVSTTRSDLEMALKPSKRAVFDSVSRLQTDEASRVRHLARAATHRAELARYRDSISRAMPIQEAVARAAKFLPPRATEGKIPPLVAFAIFRDDAYSLGPEAIIVDLDHVLVEGGLDGLLAHEFHHSFLSGLNAIQFPPGPDSSVALVRALNNTRNEGIADLIDKPYPLGPGKSEGMSAYAKRYNDAYARTPAVIRSIDSLLVIAADDSTRLADVGRRVQQLLPSNGHYNGSYVARAIYETFGVDSLLPGVSNPFAFWRAYASVERKRGNPPPFSPKAVALLAELERKYLREPRM
jgi:hypothetical protein